MAETTKLKYNYNENIFDWHDGKREELLLKGTRPKIKNKAI